MDRIPSSLDYSSYLHLLSLNRWRESILEDDFRQAEIAARNVAESPEPFWKWIGTLDLAITELYLGRLDRALHALDDAVAAFGSRGRFAAVAHALAAHVLIERGEAGAALERAFEALRQDTHAEDGLFFAVVALVRLERSKEVEPLTTSARPWQREHGRGEVLLETGDARSAVNALRQAETLLSSRAEADEGLSLHVPLWFSLARAHFAEGEDEKALDWFSRIADAGPRRIGWPLFYVRSYEYLQMICGRTGADEEREKHLKRLTALRPESPGR